MVLRSTSVTALLAAAIDGLGLAVVAGPASIRDLGLVRLFEISALPPRPLWLVTHPDAARRAAVRAVATHVRAVVERGQR